MNRKPTELGPSDILDDPASLLRQTRENFSISHDIQLLTATEENLKQLQLRTEELKEQHRREITSLEAGLEEHLRSTENMRVTQRMGSQQLASLSHSQELVTLTQELEGLEQELVQIHNELDEGMKQLLQTNEASLISTNEKVEDTPVVLQNPVERSNLLKLQLYTSLGVRLDTDHNQALTDVGNGNGIDLISLEDSSISAYYRTKYVWDRL